jgi:hypothetical protein
MFRLIKLVIWLPMLLASACAIGDAGTPTLAPPVTLMPPPEITFQGDCNVTHDLEMWLQISTQLRDQFLTLMNETAAKNKGEMRDGVLMMGALRDSMHQVVTPDCAVEIELALSDTINQAVTAFQAYINGDRPDLGDTIARVTERMEAITLIQDQLALRMETQLQQAQATAAAP